MSPRFVAARSNCRPNCSKNCVAGDGTRTVFTDEDGNDGDVTIAAYVTTHRENAFLSRASKSNAQADASKNPETSYPISVRIDGTTFSRFYQTSYPSDVAITLDRTKRQARPCLLVVTRLIIEAGGSVTQGNTSCLLSRPTHHRWLSWGFGDRTNESSDCLLCVLRRTQPLRTSIRCRRLTSLLRPNTCEDRRSLSLPDSTRQDASPMFVRHHHPREIGGRASLPLASARWREPRWRDAHFPPGTAIARARAAPRARGRRKSTRMFLGFFLFSLGCGGQRQTRTQTEMT